MLECLRACVAAIWECCPPSGKGGPWSGKTSRNGVGTPKTQTRHSPCPFHASIDAVLFFYAQQDQIVDTVILMPYLYQEDDRYYFVLFVQSTLLAAGDGSRRDYVGKPLAPVVIVPSFAPLLHGSRPVWVRCCRVPSFLAVHQIVP
jgi:hypothetical protein